MAEKEYIERGALLEYAKKYAPAFSSVIEIIALSVPATDVVEVRHGRWKAYPDGFEICATEFECLCCGKTFCTSELTDEEFLEMMKFCPNCGSKMDGGRKCANE